jgi:HK97 family phage prohead protease
MTPINRNPTIDGAYEFSYDAKIRAVDDKAPIIDFVGSTGDEDRYGSVIDPRGWVLTSYLRNPVVLFAHDHSGLPVGRTTKLTPTKNALNFRVEFATFNDRSREVYEMVKAGFMSGVSVGFIPLEAVPYEATTVTHTAENLRYTKVELLELSIVAIPANRAALKNALSSGRLSERTVDALRLRPFLNGGPAFPLRFPAWEPSPATIRHLEALMARRRSR